MRHNHFTRAASLAPTTFDAESNTVELTLSTGADVRRAGYIERLPIANADLSGIVGAPVLDTHNQGSTRAVLGVIEKAWKTAGEIRARIKLSARDDVAGIVADVRDGILRSVSVGYVVSKWRDESNSKGERIRTALAWKIHEASFVPIGADPGAVVRSQSVKTKKKTGANPPAENDTDVIDVVDNNENIVRRARKPVRDVFFRALTRNNHVSPEDLALAYREADEILDNAEDGDTEEELIEAARTRALEVLQERTSRAPRVRIVSSHDDPAAIATRQQGALFARMTGAAPKPEEREFYYMRCVDYARQFLTTAGVSLLGLSEFDIIARAISTRAAHTASDFGGLLTGTGNRLLLEQFEAFRTALMQLGRLANAPDFRPLNRLRISEMGAVTVLGGENSELKNVSRSEVVSSYQIDTAGLIFALSFAAIQNDDLGAFADFGRAAAQAVAQYQRQVLIALIEGNPVMSEDGQPLFSAAHRNVLTPGPIIGAGGDLSALRDARYLIRTQLGLDNSTTLNLTPRFLVVGAGMETEAQQALSEVFAANVGDVNAFESAMTLIVESGLDPHNWFVFTNPSAAPVFEHAWLQGFTGPQLASQENFRTLAMDFRCVAHWGAGLLPGGWRGAVANFNTQESNSGPVLP